MKKWIIIGSVVFTMVLFLAGCKEEEQNSSSSEDAITTEVEEQSDTVNNVLSKMNLEFWNSRKK